MSARPDIDPGAFRTAGDARADELPASKPTAEAWAEYRDAVAEARRAPSRLRLTPGGGPQK